MHLLLLAPLWILGCAIACEPGFSNEYATCHGQLVSPGLYDDNGTRVPCPAGTAAGARDPKLRYFSLDGESAGTTTSQGAVLHNFADPPTATSGWGHFGLAFDGVDDYVELPTWEMGGEASFEVYFKPTSYSQHGVVFDFASGAWDAGGFNLYLRRIGTSANFQFANFQVANPTDQEPQTDLGNIVALHSWVHLVISLSPATGLRAFRDGQISAEDKTMPVPVTRTRAMHQLGRQNLIWSLEHNFKGIIRYFAVYDRALILTDQATATTTYRISLAGASV